MTDNSSSSTTCCAACLLPPRPSPEKDGEFIPLLRCSRCREVWYHDVTCQRKHYKIHKQTCLAHSKNSSTTNKEASRASAPTEEKSSAEKQFVVEERPGKGRCMIASQTIPRAQPILNSANNSNNNNSNNIYFEAMVPPVLLTKIRSQRCAVCFKDTYHSSTFFYFERNPHHMNYPVMLCSPECVKAGTPWLAEEERLMVKILEDDDDDDKKNLGVVPSAKLNPILPCSIYVYRVCLAMMVNNDPHIQTTMDTLQVNPEWSSLSLIPGNSAYAYVQPSLLQVRRMIQERLAATSDSTYHHQPPLNATAAANLKKLLMSSSDSSNNNQILQILGKLIINGCNVCDGELEPIGVGIFPIIATCVNHSCRPNTLHTFAYGNQHHHQPPRLRLTTCRTIVPGEEICISYIDNLGLRQDRHQRLSHFGFICHCSYCTDDVHEQSLVGLKCMKCGGQCRLNPSSTNNNNAKVWQCASCHTKLNNNGGKQVLKTMKEFEGCDPTSGHSSLQRVQRFYRFFRKHCTSSSWYYRQSALMYASNLIQVIDIDESNNIPSNEQKTKMAQESLMIFDQLVLWNVKEQVDDDANGWKLLHTNMIRYMAAKLRMRFGRDTATTTSGMQEMNQVRNAWLLYYPPDHEIFELISLL